MQQRRRTSLRTERTWTLNQATYDAANELTSWGGLVPTYDADGEMTTDVNGNQYSWNARNQLTAISGTTSAAFGYDAFGRRISKAIGAASVSFQYDGPNRIAETSGGATAWLLPGALDEYFQRTDANGSTVPLMDALGSTIGMTDGTGSLGTTYWYDPFGGTTVGGATNGNSSQFAGRESDESGLYYNRARYYSTATRRFLSEDPLGFAGSGTNLYAYAANNPISLRDPFGLSSRPNSPFANPALWALMIGTEVAGGGPEDPLADAAVAEEIAAAEEAAGAATPETYVIGRQPDVADFIAANGTDGYNFLNLPDGEWSPEINAQWVQQGIDDGANFQIASDLNSANTFNGGQFNDGFTVFGVELGQLFNAGYSLPLGSGVLIP